MLCYWWEAGSPCTFISPLRTPLLEHWNLPVPKLILQHSSAHGGWSSPGTGLPRPGVMQCFMLWAWLSIASLPAALVAPVSGTSFLLQLLYPNVWYNMEEFSSEAFFLGKFIRIFQNKKVRNIQIKRSSICKMKNWIIFSYCLPNWRALDFFSQFVGSILPVLCIPPVCPSPFPIPGPALSHFPCQLTEALLLCPIMCIPVQFHAFILTMPTQNSTFFTYTIANTWLNHDQFNICNEISLIYRWACFLTTKCFNYQHLLKLNYFFKDNFRAISIAQLSIAGNHCWCILTSLLCLLG